MRHPSPTASHASRPSHRSDDPVRRRPVPDVKGLRSLLDDLDRLAHEEPAAHVSALRLMADPSSNDELIASTMREAEALTTDLHTAVIEVRERGTSWLGVAVLDLFAEQPGLQRFELHAATVALGPPTVAVAHPDEGAPGAEAVRRLVEGIEPLTWWALLGYHPLELEAKAAGQRARWSFTREGVRLAAWAESERSAR